MTTNTANKALFKIRMPERLAEFMNGSEIWYNPDDLEKHGYGEAGRDLVYKMRSSKVYADGSQQLRLTADEAQVMREYAETLAVISNQGDSDPSNLADLNSARAVMRNLAKLGL